MNDQNNNNSNEPTLRPHSYDGITEYDQKLPNWWLFTFYIAIAFFVVFWVLYYQTSLLRSDTEILRDEIARIDSIKAKELESMLSELDDSVLWKMSQNTQVVAAGKATFQGICHTCHGVDLSAKLEGMPLPGLPLNDSEWKYGGRPMEVFHIVTEGSPDITKGMQSWKAVLGPKKIAEVVAYVMSHHQAPAE
jgi:cytochrome c oxidase cbb3-type subunit 3